MNRMDTSPRSEEEFDDFRLSTYPKPTMAAQRVMIAASTPKKSTDKLAFIRDYEGHTATIKRYPKQAAHWKGKSNLPSWLTQNTSTSELILQQTFLNETDILNTHINPGDRELHITGAYNYLIIIMNLHTDDTNRPKTISIIKRLSDNDSSTSTQGEYKVISFKICKLEQSMRNIGTNQQH